MSTRATVHFLYEEKDNPLAIIYRHCDGYPDGLGEDLKTFLEEVKNNVEDNRFSDPNYLAAKFVVWQANRYSNKSYSGKKHYLNFLSIGVMIKDPGDIEYRYKIICNPKYFINGLPKIITELA